ncbi:MAG: heme biosynthesis protein HemY [Psychromonas sp.]|nr:heme biosynthesis protein HemY [Psychromonas sp.]
MIRVLILLIVLAIGLIYGPELSDHKGYLLVSLDSHTTYETTLINAVIIVILFYFLLLLAEWILRRFFSMSSFTRNYFDRRNTRKAQKNRLLGMLALFEGNTKQAHTLLLKSARRSDAPVLNYIAAAKAAQFEGKYDLRDEDLLKATECGKGSLLAVGLIWVELQLDAKQYEHALPILRDLNQKHPNNRQVSLRLLDVYRHLNEWRKYLDLLSAQGKRIGLKENELEKLRLEGYRQFFEQLACESGEKLKLWWDNIAPRWMRKEFKYQKALLDAYAKNNREREAEQFLIEKLNKQFSLPLLSYIKKLTLIDYYPLIGLLENKLKSTPGEGIIHQALAYLMLKENKKEAAISHLQISLQTVPSIDDYALLANLLENNGQFKEAQTTFRDGLLFAEGC